MVPLSVCCVCVLLCVAVAVPRPAGPVPGLVVIKTLHSSQGPTDEAYVGLAEGFAYPGNGQFVATASTVRPHPTRIVDGKRGPPPHHAPFCVPVRVSLRAGGPSWRAWRMSSRPGCG